MFKDWISHIEFAFPVAFGLFSIFPFIIWWYFKRTSIRQATMKVSTVHAFTKSSFKSRLRHLPFFLRILAMGLLIVAIARPRTRNEEKRTVGEGIDIVLCMDVSGSMGSRDVLPSRLEVAKEMAVEFVRNRPVDRIGLVIFSGESFTQCPITTDRNTLINQIEALESRRYLIDGTVIGEGLATSVDRLSKNGGKSKVIILLTDGKEDPPKTRLIDPVTAMEIAKSQGVKVYTIGLSAKPSTVVEIVRAPKGKETVTGDLDEELLRRIANETGGRYFRARDKEGLKNIYGQIDKMEKSSFEVVSTRRYKEEFLPFVLAALALVFLELVLRYWIFRRFP